MRKPKHWEGHVIGVQHEHQRPDRDNFLVYKPRNLEGYDEALAEADTDEKACFEDDDSLEIKKKLM